jgi:hypothetical protein
VSSDLDEEGVEDAIAPPAVPIHRCMYIMAVRGRYIAEIRIFQLESSGCTEGAGDG